MNRSNLFRTLSLSLASLAFATAGVAGSVEHDQLASARHLATTDAHVAQELQTWITQRDIALLAQADGLITNDMRAAAEVYAVAQLVEADGLVSEQLRAEVEMLVVTRLAAADGLVVEPIVLASSTGSAPAARASRAAVLLAAKTR
ncbi:MAG: hypothetical protein IV105_20625 [Rhizobacter sp.]|nr:hypothetical protein [Rhizobacter sp.]